MGFFEIKDTKRVLVPLSVGVPPFSQVLTTNFTDTVEVSVKRSNSFLLKEESKNLLRAKKKILAESALALNDDQYDVQSAVYNAQTKRNEIVTAKIIALI